VHTGEKKLNPAMQAVDVVVEIDGQRVKALIPREVFEQCLRSEASPEAWLRCCDEHADLLDTTIRKRFAAKPQDVVVVRRSDFRSVDNGGDEPSSQG